MTEVRFSDHAAWRAAERHGGSVCIDHLAEEIASSYDSGWISRLNDGTLIVTITGGERFVVREFAEGITVLTALGVKSA